MVDLPDDLPLRRRSAVRLVVLDGSERMLLFHTRDPVRPAFGNWWELPGGGRNCGESVADAAVRELREETGIVVAPSALGPPAWRRRATYRYRHCRVLQDEVVVCTQLNDDAPALDLSQREPHEHDDYFGHRWWRVPDVVASTERFYPGRLPALLPAFLAGAPIDEPFEYFS